MARKKVLNKKAVIIASSLVAISLTAALIAAATHRGRHKSLQTSGFLGQTRSKTSIVIPAATQSQKHKEKSQTQPQRTWQGSETKGTTTTTTTTTGAATIISTNKIVDDEEITTSVEVPLPMVPYSTADSAAIVSSSFSSQTAREEEISVSDEARKTGESLKELIITAIKEAKDTSKETGKGLKQQTINITATADSRDIHSLEDNINSLVTLFEEMMIEIRKEHYNKQIKLLGSYKDLLRTHIKVVDARGRMASKLKPGS